MVLVTLPAGLTAGVGCVQTGRTGTAVTCEERSACAVHLRGHITHMAAYCLRNGFR